MLSSFIRRYSVLLASAAIVVLIGLTLACGSYSKHFVGGIANFSTTVFVGDSLTAGFQNGSLLDTQQPNGWAPLVAKQANFKITLPLIAPPGAPAVLKLVSVGPPPVVQQASGTTSGRDNPTEQPTDLAVPGHTVHDLLNYGPTLGTSSEDIITDLVLAFPLGNTNTQAQEAVALKPTALFIWIGNNDALPAIESGMPSSMTDLASFTADFTALMQGAHSQTNAMLIVGNIPDVTQVAYLTPAATVLAEAATQSGISTAQLSAILGITNGDFVNATGLGEVQTDLQKLAASQPTTPLDDAGVLTAAEVVQVQTQVSAYNSVIATQAKAVNGIVVDINGLFASLQPGITINNYTATTAYLGGLFSLDGIHPTNTGYALVANKFIDTMNSALGLSIADVDVATIAASDPLFGPNIKPGAATVRQRIPLVAAKSADVVMRGRAR
jgi:lysophospholipase L1-like esterase